MTQRRRRAPARLLAFLLCALGLAEALADSPAPRSGLLRLPELSLARSWKAEAEPEAGVALSERMGYLAVSFRAAPGATGRVMLDNPVSIPEWATDLSFRCTNNGAISGLWVHAIVRDADGGYFLYYTRSPMSYERGLFYPNHAPRRAREVRFHVPGLARPVTMPRAGYNITPPRPNLQPKRPFTLMGFQLEGKMQTPPEAVTWLYFTDFALAGFTPEQSWFHYVFDDMERFGELEPTPTLTAGDLSKWYGRRFDVAWEVVREYAGQPVAAGTQDFRFPTVGWEEKGPGQDYAILLARPIAIPIRERGTWWVRVRWRWFHRDRPVPDMIEQREYRLDVLRGDPPAEHHDWPADADLPGRCVRIAPDRSTLIWEPGEPMRVGVRFRKPADEVKVTALRVEVRSAGTGDLVRETASEPAWDAAGRVLVSLDLGDLPAGAYRVRGVLMADREVVDESVSLVGRKSAGKPSPAEIPAGVPGWKELRDGPRAIFHLTPILDYGLRRDPLTDWNEYYRPWLDKAAALSRDIEWMVPWNQVEPLPGVYEWGNLDRFMNYAREKGYSALLYPEWRAGNTPEWLPGYFRWNADGRVTGDTAYLFHGMRPNYVCAPAVRGALMGFLRAIAERYRGDAALQGFFIAFEHPDDGPWAGWFEGYSPESIAAFQADARARLKDIAAANRRWGTSFASWDTVRPPRHGELASDALWLDWLRFKRAAVDGFLKEAVSTWRSVDAHRLIGVYGEGAESGRWFRDQGCFKANGGSHDAMQIPGYARTALIGLPERTEDHSPGNWSAYFPTQLDASVFAMTVGGGPNTHCKAFVRVRYMLKDMENPEEKLGRYQRFMPIWQALRATEVPTIDTILFTDDAGGLLASKTSWGSWATDTWAFLGLMQAHVPVALGDDGLWQKARLLVLPTGRVNTLEEERIEALFRFVEEGGRLVMWADAAGRCLERPEEQWVLLRRLGFQPPAGPCLDNAKVPAVPVEGPVFGKDAGSFLLRDTWPAGEQPGAVHAAFLKGDPSRPAVSVRPVGKGQALVIWAKTAIPPMISEPDAAYPFWRDIARWAGVRLPTDSDQPLFWTNLLRVPDGSAWFALVMVGEWQGEPRKPASGSVRWPAVPDGTYRVTEVIHQRDLGAQTGETLRNTGLKLTLAPREVAIFRFDRQ